MNSSLQIKAMETKTFDDKEGFGIDRVAMKRLKKSILPQICENDKVGFSYRMCPSDSN